ncbi:MAG: NUDIX hydrolase [Pseudomonadota bacterium]
MLPTDLTVAAVVYSDGHYLIVEEQAMNRVVFSQPGGHIEAGESPEDAVIREVREETGCKVIVDDMIGVYLWIHPQTRQQFLRIVYAADFVEQDDDAKLDDVIVARHWLSRAEIEARRARHRSPAVWRCIQDFEAGRRESHALISSMVPLEHNVERVLAKADLL